MKINLNARVLIAALAAPLASSALAENLNLGEGLAIEQPEAGISYQSIPSYNASKKMLLRRTDDKLQYFISIDRLPRNAVNHDQYFDRLTRDLNDSNGNSLQILDQGQYDAAKNVRGYYIEYVFVPADANKAQHQIAHFLTNSYRSYIAIAVLVNSDAEQQMRDNALEFFKTATISTVNAPMPVTESAAK